MSRHRAVKNLDLDDEMDDDIIDSGGEDYDDEMTSEQSAQMASGLTAVQGVLGPQTPISDREIRSALWDSYFDVDGTVAYLLDEQHKKEAARVKAEGNSSSALLCPQTFSMSLSSGGGYRVPLSPSSATPLRLRGGSSSFSSPAPPTESLASLSLEPPKKLSKLGARMAAGASRQRSSAPPPAAEDGQEQGGKPLSKLQAKMAAARQSRSSPAAPPPSSAAEDPAPTEPTPQPEPAPSSPEDAAAPSLAAPPSLFASALSPLAACSSSLVAPPKLRREEAKRIEQSLTLSSGAGGVQAFGESPDDRVLKARAGTALGTATAGPKRR